MVVEERHRLITAMNVYSLSIRRNEVAHLRAILRNAESVDPGLPNGLTKSIFIGVALEVVHDHCLYRGESPDVAFVEAAISADFIDLPVVPLSICKRTGLIPGIGHRRDERRAIDDGLLIVAEVHFVRDCFSSAAPVKNNIQRHICISHGRFGIACLDRDVGESYFTKAVLVQQPLPVRIDGQPDKLCEHAAQIDGRVVRVGR